VADRPIDSSEVTVTEISEFLGVKTDIASDFMV
jgi:hypothetical protein